MVKRFFSFVLLKHVRVYLEDFKFAMIVSPESLSDIDCEHTNIYDDTCEDCGYVIETMMEPSKDDEYAQDGINLKKRDKREKFSYLGELSRLRYLDEDVRNEVFEKISQMEPKSHIRLATHKKTLFIFIYIAYNYLGKSFDPAKLGEDLGLKPKQIRLAIKTASEGNDILESKNPICMIPPRFYFEGLSKKCKSIHEFSPVQIQNLTDLSEILMSTNPMIYNERPIGIAATLIKMFLEHNKLMSTSFYAKCGMTPGYIKGVESLVITTLNTMVLSKEI